MWKIKREIKHFFQRHIRGWDDSECWNLNYSFILWINSRAKVYLRQANEIVDLEFHKFTYNNKEYNQLELISKIIELSDWIISSDDYPYEEEILNKTNELLDIFKLIFPSLWW